MTRYFYSFSTLVCTLLLIPSATHSAVFTLHTQQLDTHHLHLNLSVTLPEHDFIYSDYLNIYIDNPTVTLSEWQPSIKPINRYDHNFRETKTVFPGPFALTSSAYIPEIPERDTHLHISYYQHSRASFAHERIKLPFTPLHTPTVTTVPAESTVGTSAQTSAAYCPVPAAQTSSWSAYVTNLFKTTESVTIRLLLCLLLGLLLSFTPCIYPMIPITIGVLQAQHSPSLWHNFLLAGAYTMGVSCTFAALGLLATSTGKLFGSIMTQPVVVIALVCLLVYLALSMMGFYEMYTPAFLQPKNNAVKQGSFISVFLFGVASGTVSSPCVSPGLALLLSVVSTLNNYLLGFLLLFSFGVGLSLPLLIIGTFSNSIRFLPRAGFWMVEVKHFFGLMMLGTCFYFLKNIVSWPVLLWLMVISALTVGILEFYSAQKAHGMWRTWHRVLGTTLLSMSIILLAVSYYQPRLACIAPTHAKKIHWLDSYEMAKQKALEEKKYLFVYLTAPFCTMCSAIERCILAHPDVFDMLQNYVLAKIDMCDESLQEVQFLKNSYSIVGVPTYLLIDVEKNQLRHRWGSELYDQGTATFIEQLTALK